MSAAPASSVEAGGPWMAGSAGSLQRFARPAPARRPPFPFPWVVAGSSCPTSHNPPLQVGKCAFFSMDREMVSAAAPARSAGADAPGHCHCLDAPTVLVQWQNSPRLSHLSFLFLHADPTPWTLRSPMGRVGPFYIPRTSKAALPTPSAAPQQSPNPPEPTHDQSAFLLSLPPHARLTTGHLSLTHLLFVPLSPLSPSVSLFLCLPINRPFLKAAASLRAPKPPSPPTYQDIFIRQ